MAAKMLAFSELSNLLDEKNETTEIQLYPNFLNCKKVEWKEIAQLLELILEMTNSIVERPYEPLGCGKDKSYEEALKVVKLDKENFSSSKHSVPVQLMVKLFNFMSTMEQLINRFTKRLSKEVRFLPLLKLNYEKPSISEINAKQLTNDYPFARIRKRSEIPVIQDPSPYETLQYLDGKFDRIKTEEYAWEIYLKDFYDTLIQLDVFITSIIFHTEFIEESIIANQKLATNIVSLIVSIAYVLKSVGDKWQLIQKYCKELCDLKLICVDGDKISNTLFKLSSDTKNYHQLLQGIGTDHFMKPIIHSLM